jgi:hypothetical protein
MSTSTLPATTTTTGLPACPWWCTSTPASHSWEQERDGSWTRLHRRQVGGFTMSASESVTPRGESQLMMHPTLCDVVLVDSAAQAVGLSEDLHQVAAILRRIEAGSGQ